MNIHNVTCNISLTHIVQGFYLSSSRRHGALQATKLFLQHKKTSKMEGVFIAICLIYLGKSGS